MNFITKINCDYNILKRKGCIPAKINKPEKILYVNQYLNKRKLKIDNNNFNNNNIGLSLSVNHNILTNSGVLRKYHEGYLKDNPFISKDYTCVMHQLQPIGCSIPIKILSFLKNHGIFMFENSQSDIFEHILAIFSGFGLKKFQRPSCNDFKSAISN